MASVRLSVGDAALF